MDLIEVVSKNMVMVMGMLISLIALTMMWTLICGINKC